MLSVCIITKNEEKNIGRCLQCLKPYGFEVIVADTGSTDNTKQIAKEYTEHVYDFVWCDDFAAAKNFAVSKAQAPYILSLDSDEFVEFADVRELERLLRRHENQAGRIRLKNIFTRNGLKQENTERLTRIFPKDKFLYTGRIHEQITAADGKTYQTYEAPVVVLHTGYDLTLEDRKKKAERNKILLQKELDRILGKTEEPHILPDNEQIAYILYQLGKSCYMEEDYPGACMYFSKGLSYDLNPKLEFVVDMVETYGYALLNSGQAEEAIFFENIYDEFGNTADFQFLMGLIYMNNARFEQAVLEFMKAAKQKSCKSKGVNSYAAYYNIGVIYECLGRKKEAAEYYRRCGAYEPAVKRLSVM